MPRGTSGRDKGVEVGWESERSGGTVFELGGTIVPVNHQHLYVTFFNNRLIKKAEDGLASNVKGQCLLENVLFALASSYG